MTMPGRFFVQKFLYKAVAADCKYAIVEMTSEGAKNYRHTGVNIDTLIFTNLSPEHIESHGGFENYKSCKLRLAKAVETSNKKVRTIVVNSDDKYAKEFLDFNVDRKLEYAEEESKKIKLSVDGDFNKLNALAAKTFALSIGISEEVIDKALLNLKVIPGRVQHIRINENSNENKKQNFEVIVDYAHTEDSLEKIYKTYQNNYIIGVLGACGGGRDSEKRAKLGSVAYSYCNEIIVTDEDPYDDNPREIMEDVMSGVLENVTHLKNENTKRELEEKYKIIEDRREAINYAINQANKYINTLPLDMIKAANIMPQKPIVIISGKGTDPYIMRANGKREKWSDAKVAEEELEKVLLS
jgi:UDP-N-acetylmuramoyl-L-alanyl-D-glutamate--2,6-diaminopimelate ligase